MDLEQQSTERDLWAVQIKQLLQAEGYVCAEQFGPAVIRLIATLPPGQRPADWWCKLTISSPQNARTQLAVNDSVFAFSMNARIKTKLLGVLQTDMERFIAGAALTQERETEAKRWADRQAKELKGLPEYKGVTFQITPGSGRYVVIFEAGHPLEQLTLPQVKAFHKFLRTLNAQIQT